MQPDGTWTLHPAPSSASLAMLLGGSRVSVIPSFLQLRNGPRACAALQPPVGTQLTSSLCLPGPGR